MLVLSLGFSSQTFAAFLVEPYAGINFNGSWEDHGSDSSDSFSGSMYGARVGVQKFGFMAGLDVRKGSWEVDNTAKDEFAYTHYAAFIGYDFPILVRVYAEYVLGGTAEEVGGNNLIEPAGFVFGAGYKFFPFLSANLEAGSVSYKELELEDGTNLKDREEAATYLLLSLSVPFSIGL